MQEVEVQQWTSVWSNVEFLLAGKYTQILSGDLNNSTLMTQP